MVKRFCSMGLIGTIGILIVVTRATASSPQASCSRPSTFVATEGKNEELIVISQTQEKTKKITTVTVVWICDPSYHKILPTSSLNFSKNY